MAAWLRDLSAQQQAFHEKLSERQALTVPSRRSLRPEDHLISPFVPTFAELAMLIR
jgi:hypothetical protein